MPTILSYLRRSTRPAKPAFDKPQVWRIVPVLLVCLLAIVCGTLLQSPDRRAASADRPPGNLSARSEILAARADSDVRKPSKTGVPQIDYANLPLFFEPNVGQSNPAVRYLARGAGYGLFLTSDGVTLSLLGPPAKAGATVALKFVGANASPHLSGLDPLPGKSNYFVGDDSSRWQTGLTQYARVRYEQLYAGIDAIFYGKQRELEYDLVISPQADPSAVTLHFEGAASLHLDTGGDLLLETPLGEVRQRRPVAYQEFDGERRPVDASFRLQGRRLTFDIGPYDRSRPLVIDPEIAYQRTIGGSSSDSASGITVDSAGNVYITGTTFSTDFPTANPFQPGRSGPSDAFVLKLDIANNRIVYASYLGGSSFDNGRRISVDTAGNSYIMGDTESTNFPTASPLQPANGGGRDCFLAKIGPAGNTLLYSTYLGGSATESVAAHLLGPQGSVYFSISSTALTKCDPAIGILLARIDTD